SRQQLDDVIDLSLNIQLDGLVIANTTIDRSGLSLISKELAEKAGSGGLSGFPLKEKSSSILKYVAEQTNRSIPLIGSGGIFTGQDAVDRIKDGASLVQVWTGFIYEGPAIAKKINK